MEVDATILISTQIVAIVPESVEPCEPSKGRIVRCFQFLTGSRTYFWIGPVTVAKAASPGARYWPTTCVEIEFSRRVPQPLYHGLHAIDATRAPDSLVDLCTEPDRNGFRELRDGEVILEVVADRPVRKSTSERPHDGVETRRDNLIPTQAPTRPWPGRG